MTNRLATSPRVRVDPESALRQAVSECAYDPLKFVLMAYCWGKPGTPLASFKGPDEWQRHALRELGEQLRAAPHTTIREADGAAHGVGKSALTSWRLQWGMSTFPDTRAVATAGTFDQLRSKLIPEHNFWYHNLLCRHWFNLQKETMFSVEPGHEESWKLEFLTWDEKRPEAFAGLHAAGRRIVFAVDEASQVPQVIFDTIEGALTDADTEKLFLIGSNTTRNSGPFFEAMEGKHRNRWKSRRIDGRDSERTDKQQIAEWIEAYGEDSDFVRVRVAAKFPRVGDMQFFSRELADEAVAREATSTQFDPLIFGLDVAREGSDESVLSIRRGRDARSIPWLCWRIPDLMQLAARVAEQVEKHNPDAVFVDAGGMGAGVYDRLRQLNVGFKCHLAAVNFGGSPVGYAPEGERIECANRAAEMWTAMRAWSRLGALPNDPLLISDLTGREYGHRDNGALILERKKDMKKRGLSSPDRADALSLTFAEPVTIRNAWAGEQTYETDYPIFSEN